MRGEALKVAGLEKIDGGLGTQFHNNSNENGTKLLCIIMLKARKMRGELVTVIQDSELKTAVMRKGLEGASSNMMVLSDGG